MFRESLPNILVLSCVCATDILPNFLLKYLASVGSILPRVCRSFRVSLCHYYSKFYFRRSSPNCPIIFLHFHVIPHTHAGIAVCFAIVLLLYLCVFRVMSARRCSTPPLCLSTVLCMYLGVGYALRGNPPSTIPLHQRQLTLFLLPPPPPLPSAPRAETEERKTGAEPPPLFLAAPAQLCLREEGKGGRKKRKEEERGRRKGVGERRRGRGEKRPPP